MNPTKNLVIAKNEIITEKVKYIKYNHNTKKKDVLFKNGKTYSYTYDNVLWIREPVNYSVESFSVLIGKRKLSDVSGIYLFQEGLFRLWYITFYTHEGQYFNYRDIKVKEISKTAKMETTELRVDNNNRLSYKKDGPVKDEKSQNVFEYLKKTSELNEIKDPEGGNILSRRFEKLNKISTKSAMASYLNPDKYRLRKYQNRNPVFPFGCNSSQYKAVKNALENQISVIEGPPGTGKTQTILNIVANILLEGKTVLVVSNNNSATENIKEKLSNPKCAMDFMLASLGKYDNKTDFLDGQTGIYPDISGWNQPEEHKRDFLKSLEKQSENLNIIYEKQEEKARLEQLLHTIEKEYIHHKEINVISFDGKPYRRKGAGVTSGMLMEIRHYLQELAESNKKISFFKKLDLCFIKGIFNWKMYNKKPDELIFEFQNLYYLKKTDELKKQLEKTDKFLSDRDREYMPEKFTEDCLNYFKGKIYTKYSGKKERPVFTDADLRKHPEKVLDEYPVVLSTSFSATNSLGKGDVYDYVIMDEASQIDVATGAMSLYCAENAVIVGDRKQLPNIVTREQKKKFNRIYESYNLEEGYNVAENSFLESVCRVIKDAPCTLLREHYRCHPEIINFCNQKFYDGELVVMTKEANEKNVLTVTRTVKGNHERNHTNQREVDVICNEVLPEIEDLTDIGIIAPYRNQVKLLRQTVTDKNIEIDTVHKFQGREKDGIILTTVDNKVTEFSDDPYLLNVAISRAKKNLHLVMSGNTQPEDSNIQDLLSYIEYNNFEVRDSRLYSVFDYLYTQYSKSRFEYLKKHKRVSEYNSENLMYGLVCDVLKEKGYTHYGVICHQPLNALVRDLTLLTEREAQYILNPATHLDFLIYNKVSKKPVLAIEVDGWKYHREGTAQAERDAIKNSVLDKYKLPYVRFATNGSNEREKLIEKLESI